MTRRRTAASAIGDVLLTIAAVGGATCITLVAAAFAFNVSIMLFTTGSMSPAIPAGAAALVREVPASSVAIGDVVTVDRPGKLPVTHRVVAIAGTGAERELTLRGDANPAEDPAPYRVSTVRIVMFSVPGAAGAIAALGHPLVLGLLTVGATVLVVWAFWPRSPRGSPRGPVRSPVRAGRHTGAAPGTGASFAVSATAVALLIGAAPAAEAVAATSETIVQGEVIRLTSIGDAAAMGSLAPGESAVWVVGVQADAPSPGVIRMSLTAEGPANPLLEVTVTACDRRTVATCSDGSVLVPETPLAVQNAFELGSMTDAEERWLRVETRLSDTGSDAPVQSVFTVSAVGFGESVSTDGETGLARSGVDGLAPWALAAGCLVAGATGAVIAAGVRRRRAS